MFPIKICVEKSVFSFLNDLTKQAFISKEMTKSATPSSKLTLWRWGHGRRRPLRLQNNFLSTFPAPSSTESATTCPWCSVWSSCFSRPPSSPVVRAIVSCSFEKTTRHWFQLDYYNENPWGDSALKSNSLTAETWDSRSIGYKASNQIEMKGT